MQSQDGRSVGGDPSRVAAAPQFGRVSVPDPAEVAEQSRKLDELEAISQAPPPQEEPQATTELARLSSLRKSTVSRLKAVADNLANTPLLPPPNE